MAKMTNPSDILALAQERAIELIAQRLAEEALLKNCTPPQKKQSEIFEPDNSSTKVPCDQALIDEIVAMKNDFMKHRIPLCKVDKHLGYTSWINHFPNDPPQKVHTHVLTKLRKFHSTWIKRLPSETLIEDIQIAFKLLVEQTSLGAVCSEFSKETKLSASIFNRIYDGKYSSRLRESTKKLIVNFLAKRNIEL